MPRARRLWPFPLAAAASAALLLSPWPAALLIRGVFYRGAQQLVAQMAPYAPEVTEHRALKYQADGGTRRLDLYLPPDRTGLVPVVFWIHGGAWISGSRRDVAPYLRMLAGRGFAAVGVDYSVAPGARYPVALNQLDSALRFLEEHAGQYGLDMRRVVIAGDSAGAQLAAQLTAAVSAPEYAAALGFSPTLPRKHLRGAVLHCGVYDLKAMSELTGILGWGFRTALWAYTGTRDFARTAAADHMSVLEHATPDFPPAFISGGNGDGLTLTQSVPFANRLESLGVPVTRRFWPGLSPALPHEAQFQFSRPEAGAVLDETQTFLVSVVGQDGILSGMSSARPAAGTLPRPST
ncbi:alpha/beta hydrolase [Arthrobacter sp. 7Tela_A1]|uniref:alpha/beta hydrolase n=1 Tax=Arthrobacter sp. 7Tela_A1 TaxID=3093745 RepID=UPI003BB66C6A